MDRFDNFEELKKYIENTISNTKELREHRLYSKEQYQIVGNREVLKYQNSIEWIIRLNKILKFINYSITKTLEFIDEDFSLLEECENKDMYTYYLEDSVYRLITVWDIYKQLLNEIYQIGFNRDKNYSIYQLLKKVKKERIWDKNKFYELFEYIDSDGHKFVRNYLRNSFAHNNDPTSMYVFHDMNSKGKLLSDSIKGLLPKSPCENILKVVEDLEKVYYFVQKENKYLLKKLEDDLMLVEPKLMLECGIEFKGDLINIKDLKENLDNIISGSKNKKCKSCEYSFEDGEFYVCKPKSIKYSRIYEDEKEVKLK
ncbi:Cthe_2314 family HEPN domain-containing protein [Clostridium perfringens]